MKTKPFETLEDGKTYINRKGESVTVRYIGADIPEDKFPYVDTYGVYYTKTGRFYSEESNICNLDLIEEVIKGEVVQEDTPSSDTLCPGIDQVPFEGIEAIGLIFKEGEEKYGRDNWKKQPDNKEYTAERTRHAIRHLWLYANGDRSEPHLAKVAWFCVTTIWREKQNDNK